MFDTPANAAAVSTGAEWLVEAYGCAPPGLSSLDGLQRLFARIVADLDLHPLGDATWHVFPHHGGVSGMALLSESHLTCHTFPEHGFATFNLYCCRPRPSWPWARHLTDVFGATSVDVQMVSRGPRQTTGALRAVGTFPDRER